MKISNMLKGLSTSRYLIFLVIFFLFSNLVLAETIETHEITLNDSVEVDGRTITLEQISNDGKVVIDVEGEGEIFEISEIDTVNGVILELIEMYYISELEGTATFEITVEYECGDDVCNAGEIGCCEDCSDCGNDETCNDNICVEELEDECDNYLDCDDSDDFTLDSCEGDPKICVNENQTEKVECYINSDCNVEGTCLSAICSSNECGTTSINSCVSNDGCCPATCSYPDDLDCKALCTKNKQCEDSNPCSIDTCENGGCMHSIPEGCVSKNNCYQLSERRKVEGITSYCSLDNKWKAQKSESKTCIENSECKSNKCAEGICTKPGFNIFNFIIGLFTKIFG